MCQQLWSHERYALDKRFVQLTLLVDQGEEAQGPRWQGGSEKFRDLHEVLQHVTESAIVVLGPPGSGKSTLLRHFELETAQAALQRSDLTRTPLTLFVSLNAYAPVQGTAPEPLRWLAEQCSRRFPELTQHASLETLLRQRQVILLFDGFNEMPIAGPEPVRQWRAFVRDLAQFAPHSRVIFSCRSLDYSASLSSRDFPVPQVRIEALSDTQVAEFVQLYCPQYGDTLWQNLRGTVQLDILRSPYYLKLLVAQTTTGEIPVGRAALFSGFVRQALRREVEGENPLLQDDTLLHDYDKRRLVQRSGWPPFDLPSRGPLIPRLSTLALQMQTRHSASEASQVRVPYDTALTLLDHPDAKAIVKMGADLAVLEHDLGRDAVLYVHQLLQEYFAARHLAQQPQPHLVQQAWQAEQVRPGLAETLRTLADSDPLSPLPATGWEETMVLAVAMAAQPEAVLSELMEQNLPLAGRCAAQPEVVVSEGLKERVRWALVQRTQDPAADLRARIAAGLALGELGDPRLVRHEGPEGAYLLPPLIALPGGTYRIGSDEGLYADEVPVHAVTLAAFALGQFPVTNAEWAFFIQAGGYEEERWWETEAARAWRRGEGTAEGPKQSSREARKYIQDNLDAIRRWPQEGRATSQEIEDYESYAAMSDEEFAALLEGWYPPGRQTQPHYWNDPAFNNPAQPVVGICWFEACAYCAWLRAQTGAPFRLPTEVEWEAAARGPDNRHYAFGDDFDASRCNAFESHIRGTTPIGVFPGGTTPEGVVDLPGNVWEWTSSLYQPYPYDASNNRGNYENNPPRRVLRGGPWGDGRAGARAAYRSRNVPGSRFYSVGLRVGRSSPVLPRALSSGAA